MLTMLRDGLVNLASGMGTLRDKAGQAEYQRTRIDRQKLLDAYYASAMVRKVIEIPAEDAVRAWREWQAKGVQIDKIEALEKTLGLRQKVFQARRMARLLGFSAILIGDGADDPSQPLEPERKALQYLTVLEPGDLAVGELDLDPLSPYFRQPSYWRFMSATGGHLKVHPSRLAVFHGIAPLATFAGERSAYDGGESVLTGMLDALKRVDEGAANILSLVYEGKVDVIRVKDFMNDLRANGDEYAEEMMRRLSLAMTAKGNNGTLILDAEEEYEQKQSSFGGLGEVIDRFMILASGAAGLPQTLMFGTSPAGLNATGESDVRNYYDRVRVQQELHMTPAMGVLDECLIWTALGSRPEELHYNWRPLWQESAKEKAENADKLATAAQKVFGLGGISPEAITEATVNALTEAGTFGGLEAAMKRYPGVPDGDDPAEEGAPAAQQPGDEENEDD